MFVLKSWLTEMIRLLVRKRLFIGIVIVLTVILNVWLSLLMHHNSTAPAQAGLWSEVAANLYHHGVYALWDRDAQGNLLPTARIPPLYTYLCFIIFSLAGVTQKAFLLIGLLSILANIGIVFVVYRIGYLFGYSIGCLAALMAMSDLNLAYLANYTATPDTLLVFLLALSYLYLLKFLKIEPSDKNTIYAALFLGLATLTKVVVCPLWLPISAFLAAFMFSRGKNLKQILHQTGLFLAVQVLLIGGWGLRNYIVTGKAQFHSTLGDILLTQTGFMKAYQEGISFSEAKVSLYAKAKEMDENEWNSYSTKTAIGMMRDSPRDYMVVMLKGFSKLLTVSQSPFYWYNKQKADDIRKFMDVKSHLPILKELWTKGYGGYVFLWGSIKLHLVIVYLMSLYGIIRLFKNKNDRWILPLLLLIASYFIFVSLPSAEFRYRYTFMPIFYLLAGYGLYAVFNKRAGHE